MNNRHKGRRLVRTRQREPEVVKLHKAHRRPCSDCRTAITEALQEWAEEQTDNLHSRQARG